MKLRGMTYNICSGLTLSRQRDITQSARVITNVCADIVALNEVRMGTSDIHGEMQALRLAELTGMAWSFGASIDLLSGQYGNAVLSRYPILSSEVIHIPDLCEADRDERFEHRSILKVLIETPLHPICVLSTHFGLSLGERQLAAETAAKVIRAETTPLLLMGDFNSIPTESVLDPLYSCLTDTANRENRPMSFPSDQPDQKIDYIFTSADFSTARPVSIDTQASDHRPLYTDLILS